MNDLQDIHQLHSIPETDKFNTLGIPENIQVTERIVSEWMAAQKTDTRTSYIYTISLLQSNQFIGLIALQLRESKFKSAEAWFKIDLHYWKNGYATEALSALLAFGFNELSLHRIEAGCAVGNIGSARVLENAGMIREGEKRQVLPIRGEWVDAYSYAILKEEFGH